MKKLIVCILIFAILTIGLAERILDNASYFYIGCGTISLVLTTLLMSWISKEDK